MLIEPNWPAPNHIKAYTTLRTGGVSIAPYDEFNLAEHVEDKPIHVRKNRELLIQKCHLPNEPCWLTQTHSNIAIESKRENTNKKADASFTNQINQICVVLTADCLPILLCNRLGTHVAAIHAGWRGIVNGIIESTIQSLNLNSSDLIAWLGPAIGPKQYEVGDEVRKQFIHLNEKAINAFSPSFNQRWLMDLYTIARLQLQKQGVFSIYGGDFCTFSDPSRFYSYRRDGIKTGRFATLIWINKQHIVK